MAHDRVFTGRLLDGCVSEKDAVGHIRKVLRLRDGDRFAGYDGECEYELEIEGGGGFMVKVLSRRELPEPGRKIVLAPAMVKGSRWETLLEKAVELGASEIWPVVAERCVVNLKGKDIAAKTVRWKKIMESASAQCAGRLPGLEEPASLGEILERTGGGKAGFILTKCEESEPAASLAEGSGAAVILVGPEGDWTDEELAEARNAGFRPVELGTRILRSETAAVAALALAAGMNS